MTNGLYTGRETNFKVAPMTRDGGAVEFVILFRGDVSLHGMVEEMFSTLAYRFFVSCQQTERLHP